MYQAFVSVQERRRLGLMCSIIRRGWKLSARRKACFSMFQGSMIWTFVVVMHFIMGGIIWLALLGLTEIRHNPHEQSTPDLNILLKTILG